MAKRKRRTAVEPGSPAAEQMAKGERDAPRLSARWRLPALAAILLLLLLVFGPRVLANGCWLQARASLQVGAVTSCQGWVDWGRWLAPRDGRWALLAATCARLHGDAQRWQRDWEAARRSDLPAPELAREQALWAIRRGEVADGVELEMGTWSEQGATLEELGDAFVRGYLARSDAARARRLLDAWTEQGVDRACGDYLWGIYWRHVGETGAAERQLRLALEQQPRREAAYVELAELFEEQSRWSEALAIWQQLARRVPQHAGALIGVARSLRKGGQADSARNWLLAIGPPTAGTEAWTLERAQLELDAAEYDSAATRLKSGQGDAEPDDERLTTAAQALALAGQGTLADELWEQVDWLVWRRARTLDLRVRLALDPSNAWLRQQWQDWQVEAAASRPRSNATLAGNPSETPRPGEFQPSARYLQFCAACHGIPGQSPGRAARYLTPRPRDLAADPMRLVSTANGCPTLADIQRVLRQGIPGTAMPAFADWTDSDREALAREILAWRRVSLDRRLVQSLQDTGDVLTAEQRAERVDELSQPGESLSVPEDGAWSQAAADRGATVYAVAGCAACHGPRGTPESPPWLYDSRGEPVAARDLQRDPFQGGDEPAAIYLRLAAGMPGTPHPSAAAALSPGDLTALTLFCRTLRQEPTRLTTNAERARRLDILSAESPVSVDPPSRSP